MFTISSLRRELSPTRTLKWPGLSRVQITCNSSSAYHVQPAVCYLIRGDSSAVKFDRVEIAFVLAFYFIDWNHEPMKEGRKPEYPEKTPDDVFQKMPHTKARKFKPQTRLEPAILHWWQARKADVLTITPRVAVYLSVAARSIVWANPSLR